MRAAGILFLLLLEIGAISFLQPLLGLYVSPVVFTGSAVLLCFLLTQKLREPQKNIAPPHSSGKAKLIFLLIAAAAVGAGWLWLRRIFPQYALDPHQSDIIPSIQVYTKRFALGEAIYADIKDFGYTISPTYLPGMWAPFVLADYLQLDYRTWAYGLFWLCVLCVMFFGSNNLKQSVALFAALFGFFLLYLHHHPEALGWTVEMMIAGFYLLLLAGLYRQNIWLLSLGLVCCLLSRYAVVLLLPFLFLLFWKFAGSRKTFFITGLTVAGVLAFFVLPFLLRYPQLLANGYRYYSQAALGEWMGQSWRKPGELPYQLAQGFGFALFFYNKANVAGSLQWFQSVHKVVAVLVPLLMTAWYFAQGKQWLRFHHFVLLLLHLYLVFFFAFIQVPYAYLFFTPAVVSLAVTAFLLNE